MPQGSREAVSRSGKAFLFFIGSGRILTSRSGHDIMSVFFVSTKDDRGYPAGYLRKVRALQGTVPVNGRGK